MTASLLLPSLTRFDPTTASEGTLDPLGLYQIADQLAVALVPAVRERMSRVRFMTAMVVGAAVTEELSAGDPPSSVEPYLVWEWLVVEALVRHAGQDRLPVGIPGSQVTRRALDGHGYLDAASYLKTPRIFGFHGVYKRLAVHLRLLDVNLGIGPSAGLLLDAWAKDLGHSSFDEAKELLNTWRTGVERSLKQAPPRTRPNWRGTEWERLATAFTPERLGRAERRAYRQLLLNESAEQLGALSAIWAIGREQPHRTLSDQRMHRLLKRARPPLRPLLDAIASYEAFARPLQDSFDAMRLAAGAASGGQYLLRQVEQSSDFCQAATVLPARYEKARDKLQGGGEVAQQSSSLFEDRFHQFGESMPPAQLAVLLLDHHEEIQRGKSADGKRSWFDRLGPHKVHLRLPYRLPDWKPAPDTYVHPYRTTPLLAFLRDIG